MAKDVDYGLYIKSHPHKDEEKTSLVLENNKPFKLAKETTLSFNLFVRRENAFGMICRMISDKRENIDLYIAIGDDGKHYPMLLVNESIYLLPNEILYEQWMQAKIDLSKGENKITVTCGTSELSIPYPVDEMDNIQISFGLCPIPSYTIYDIASVNVRDIWLLNNEKQVRYWKLEEHINGICYDSQASIPAYTKNAQWISDNYSTWNCIYRKQLKQNSLFAFNNNQEKLYILPFDRKDIILVYDVKSNKETIINTKNDVQIFEISRLIYDDSRNRLIVYNLEEGSTFVFSFDNQTWVEGKYNYSREKLKIYNRSAVYSPEDSILYLFGGYGYLKFYNELIKLNVYDNKIEYNSLQGITPRSYASTLKIGNTLYIFGGRGSKTGRQEISPQNYIDLYAVNLTTGETNCLWEQNDTEKAFFPGENMIYFEDEACFYTLIDENDLTLIRFKRNTPGYDILSYSIFDGSYSQAFYRNLYFSAKSIKFYAVTARNAQEDNILIELHTLNYPPVPLKIDDDSQADKNQPTKYGWVFGVSAVIVLFVVILLILILFSKYKNKRSKQSHPAVLSKPDSSGIYLREKAGISNNEISSYDFSRIAIRLLGEFAVIDTHGNNITKMFSPTLRDIFVLLLLHSEPDRKSVTTDDLIRLFWYDKDKEAAINNKNVYFSRLRSTLAELNHSEIVNLNGAWKIRLSDGIVCDYTESIERLSHIRREPQQTETLPALLDLLSRGILLPDIENEWIDSFKCYFSDMVIDVLTGLVQNDSYQLDDKQKLRIADILFSHDYLSEEALFLKCSILLQDGKKGSAKNIFNNFCKAHLDFLGTPYKYSFSDVLLRKNIFR